MWVQVQRQVLLNVDILTCSLCGQAPNGSAICFYFALSTHAILHVLSSVNQAFLFRASLVFGDAIYTYQ